MKITITFKSKIVGAALAGSLAAGCPAANVIPDPEERPAQCAEGGGYVAFDPANHAAQEARLGAHAAIMALFDAAIADPTQSATKMAEATELYAGTAELQAKVQGRTDEHLAGNPAVGTEIDARLSGALADAAAATTAHEIELAAETFDKTFAEFLFLSIFHELIAGGAPEWDEAFGYFGAPADNNVDALTGFAGLARRRDLNNGTALQPLLFARLAEGSCALAERLAELEVQQLDARADERLAPIIEDIDVAMLEVLASSVGHEAFEIAEKRVDADPDGARVKLVELEGFFRPVERILTERGGAAATTAASIRASVDAALDDQGDAWLATFDDAAIVAGLEAALAIDIVE